MAERPGSLPEFEAQFPDDAACARWLLERRWPDGFRCPACGHDKAWELARERLTLQCAACERQVSATAGTALHGSHLGLRTWFLAAWLMATHANGISARQLWKQLGLGSYKSAWLLVRKLRRAMVDPEREPLAGVVEVGETSLPFRAEGEPVRPGRSHDGKLLVAGAVEIRGEGPGPARGDRRLSGRRARRLHRRRQHGGERRLAGLQEAEGRQARPAGGRRYTGPHGAALGAPGVREREAVGFGRLPRPAAEAPPGLSRRVRVPVRPPPHARRRLRPSARPQPHPRARHLPDVGRQELKG